jgi:glucose-6-phosphate isomerase
VSHSGLYEQRFLLRGSALETELTKVRTRLPDAARGVAQWRAEGLPHFRLPAAREDLTPIEAAAKSLCGGASGLLLFGIGGSSLGAQALGQIAGWGTPAYRPAPGRPAIHIVENLDGPSLHGLLTRIDLTRAKILAVSKSGSTTETLVQTLLTIEAIERSGAGAQMRDKMMVIAEPGGNPLRALGKEIGCPVHDHDPKLGGRYSVLSLVGLVPAACFGLNVAAIREGAQSVLAQMDDPASPVAEGAALSVAAAQAGLGAQVMWAYADRLERFAMWWRQLWGESLGKGGKGTTPIRALGPVDQHSQLQLYLDGPKDKLFTVMTTGGEGAAVSSKWAERIGQPLLAGKTPTQIVAAQARATAETLVQAGRPVRTIHVPHLDERAMGALFMHFMLETLYAARLLGVDPFDQPAVETGKVLTRQYLSESPK